MNEITVNEIIRRKIISNKELKKTEYKFNKEMNKLYKPIIDKCYKILDKAGLLQK